MVTKLLPFEANRPFSLQQSLDFLQRFPPCSGDFSFGPRSFRGAVLAHGNPVAFEVREGAGHALELVVEQANPHEEVTARTVELARSFLGADDALAPFYEAAATDTPFRPVLRRLHGLHHVRFLTLAEVTVHAVLMQHTPIIVASQQKRAVRNAFGTGVGELVAFPSFEQLLALGPGDFQRVIRHEKKAATLPGVLRGVHALGETWLREAPYDEAREALRAIRGVGPFSAAFILLRGLGRMDEVPLEMPAFTNPARRIYGAAFDPSRIRAHYGRQLGYWAYYVKSSSGVTGRTPQSA